MVTIQELKELNARISTIKTKSASLQAEVKVLTEQLDTRTAALSQTLGVPVTKDNLESLYQQASAQLEEKATLVRTLLNDLESNPVGVVKPVAQAAPQPSMPTFASTPQNNMPAAQPAEQPVAANFANFGTSTTFQI